MLYSPNDCLVYKGTDTRQAEEMILKHYITTGKATYPGAQLELVTKSDSPFKIYRLVNGRDVEPKPFLVPLRFTDHGDNFTVFDARSSTRLDPRSRMTQISNLGLYRREVIRSYLQTLWQEEGSSAILRLGNIQIRVFATWISNIISSQFSLDAEQQVKLTTITAYYYLTLFAEPGRIDLRRSIRVIAVSLNLSEVFVQDTLGSIDGLNEIAGLDDYLNILPRALVTERLAGLTLDLFISKLTGSWFGANNVMLIGMALEYPPVFVTLLYLGLTDRSTKLARLAQVALRFERDKATTEFLSIIQNTIDAELEHFN